MKRSEINTLIKEAEAFFAKHNFKLPKFGSWTLEDWQSHGKEIEEIFDCQLGWDVTDFGRGNFNKEGLLLFTIRNGVNNSTKYTKKYAEKIMISKANQVTLMHCHETKTEDIINRAGGTLIFELYNRVGNTTELDTTPVTLVKDGEKITIPAGEKLYLSPGESITLEPNVFHKFYAGNDGDVLIGEVSSVNDDHTDNVFHEKQLRFPEIEEDEAPYRYMVEDYSVFNK